MSKIIDPITLLREYMMKQKKIRLENDELIFGNTKIPISAPTAWKKSGVSGAPEKHYTIGALWFYLTNRAEEQMKYMKEAAKLKIGIVSPPDKDQINDYFTGKTDKTDCIDEEYRVETQISKGKKPTEGTKLVLGEQNQGAEPMEIGLEREEEEKKPKGTEKEQILEYLSRNEKRIATRHSQLQGPKAFFLIN